MKFAKPVRWNIEKNNLLKMTRDISFDEIAHCMEQDGILNIQEHPNRAKYPNQKIAIVSFKGYGYSVPYVETDEEIFLKTIIPSRKATKIYMKGKSHND
jgi:effector-binding domain-containing protein